MGGPDPALLAHFKISGERMPRDLIHALGTVKKAAALVNLDLKILDEKKARAIVQAADEVLDRKHDEEFPLVVWHDRKRHPTNINVNDVLANRASDILGGERGENRLVHPNDDVNKGQSSNDVFPTAMSVAAVDALRARVVPALEALRGALQAKAGAFGDVVKLGRTHLQDATPLTLGQSFGLRGQLDHGIAHWRRRSPTLRAGPGRHRRGHGPQPPTRSKRCGWRRSRGADRPSLRHRPNKFEALAPTTRWCTPWRLKTVAAPDEDRQRRALAGSGPRCGIGEITIPRTSRQLIMPGR